MPAALAACGNRLVAVMPGSAFASRHQNFSGGVAPEIRAAIGAELQHFMRAPRVLLDKRCFGCRDVSRKYFARTARLVLGFVVE